MYGQWFHLHVRPLPTPIMSDSFPPCDVKYAYFVKATEVKGRVLISVGRAYLHLQACMHYHAFFCTRGRDSGVVFMAVIEKTSIIRKVVLHHHVRISGGHCYQHVYAHSLLDTMFDILAPYKLIAHFRIPLYNTTHVHIAPLVITCTLCTYLVWRSLTIRATRK